MFKLGTSKYVVDGKNYLIKVVRNVKTGSPTLVNEMGWIETNEYMSKNKIAPRIISTGKSGDLLFIVMDEYLYNLREYTDQFGFSSKLKSSVINKIEELHNLGIVHGDLHEENIVVNNDNDVALIDFDFAFKANSPTALEFAEELTGTVPKNVYDIDFEELSMLK